jgi:hypothetical protein
MPKLGTTIWDAALARRLYDEGATYKHIGEQVGAAASLVSAFAARHWPPREQASRKCDSDGPRPLPPGSATLPPLPSLSADPSHSGIMGEERRERTPEAPGSGSRRGHTR